jgi:5-methylcytosine-specific restriction endonuclease McrA
MSADLWSTGEGGFIGPALGNVVALGEGRKRSDYDSFVETRRRMVKNYKGLKANSYQRERFQKETTGDGRSGGELGRGNNQIRASRKKKMLKEWGSGSSVPCGYCGAKLNYKTLEMEKLVPEIGYDTFENLAPACRKCNASMYSKTFVEKIRMVSKDSPTTSDVHVPAVMGSKKKRDLKKKKMAMDMSLRKGQPLKDPKGGLTAAGRAKFNRETGSNLKPGVKGKADTPEKMKRKGSFLTRFFTNPSGPMVNDKGEPTRLALSAAAWGEPVPKDRSDAAKLAEKGRNLLDRYESNKDK